MNGFGHYDLGGSSFTWENADFMYLRYVLLLLNCLKSCQIGMIYYPVQTLCTSKVSVNKVDT